MEFVLNKEDPNEYGFIYRDSDWERIRDYLEHNFVNEEFIGEIHDKALKVDKEYLKEKNITWLCNYDFYAKPMWYLDNVVFLGKKIAVYGAGDVGKDFVKHFSSGNKIVAVLDKNYEHFGDSDDVYGFRVMNPNEVTRIDFDYIVIALFDDNQRKEVREILKNTFLIEESKIISTKPKRVYGGLEFVRKI